MVTNLKVARVKAGLLQWDLARRVGISETVLSKAESGRLDLDQATLAKISQILSVPPADLRGDASHRTTESRPK